MPGDLSPSSAAGVGERARKEADKATHAMAPTMLPDRLEDSTPLDRMAKDTKSELDQKHSKANRQAWKDMGIKTNSSKGFDALIDALVSNLSIGMICLLTFSYLRQRYRLVYQKNSWNNWGHSDPAEVSPINDGVVDFERDPKTHWTEEGDDGGPLPSRPPGHFFDWISASFRLQPQEIVTSAGLDQAMLVQFANMAMFTFAVIGIPMCLILLPMHVFLGGNERNDDPISWTDFSNIKHGSLLCWVHAFMVWFVVLVVDSQIYACQGKFVKLRVMWLETLPRIRACTILVEGIPLRNRTNTLLTAFFNEMFGGRDVVESANIVVRTSTLDFAISAHDRAKKAYDDAKRQDADEGAGADASSGTSSQRSTASALRRASSRAFDQIVKSAVCLLEDAYRAAAEQVQSERLRLKKDIARAESWTEEDIIGHAKDVDSDDDQGGEERQSGTASATASSASSASSSRCNSRSPRRHESMQDALASQVAQDVRAFNRASIQQLTAKQQHIDNLYSAIGFVTFRTRYDATMALRLTPYTTDKAEFQVSVAPDPADVEYDDMKQHVLWVKAWAILGWALIALLFIAFLPTIGFIGAFANVHNLAPYDKTGSMSEFIINHPKSVRIWNGFVSQMGLNLVLSFLPTTLVFITTLCFQHKAHSWFQHDLQKFYFVFLIVFQLLVVCMANSMAGVAMDAVADPLSLIGRLAGGMAQTTSFFLTIFASQWTIISMEHTRFIQLIKYKLWRKVTETPEEASAAAEPEDQDYYGMGARSARYTALFITGLCFVSLCPLICVMAFFTFALMRVVVGYQVVYAETKKPDLGGDFWVTSLVHVQGGLLIYICAMMGMLAERAATLRPALLAGLSFFYVLESMYAFQHKFHWESISHSEVVKTQRMEESGANFRYRKALRNTYVQPNLEE